MVNNNRINQSNIQFVYKKVYEIIHWNIMKKYMYFQCRLNYLNSLRKKNNSEKKHLFLINK